MILLKELHVHVEVKGDGNTAIILLHGWGQSTKAFDQVAEYLSSSFTVYNVDLPGFGLSERPPYPYETKDYANFLKEMIDYYQIVNPIIIGHSFGGRVAIKYSSMYQGVKKLVLVDSAGIVHKKKICYYIRVYTFKLLKHLFKLPLLKKYQKKVLSHFGSSDYKNADPLMKKVLVNVVNEDLREEMKVIHCPVLLVWGTDDTVTPIDDAYVMKKQLQDAGIVKIEKAGHFSYLENMRYFLTVLEVFFKEERGATG